MKIKHHGAVHGVTGFCHQLTLDDGRALLIDCELFQGAELGRAGAGADRLQARFPHRAHPVADHHPCAHRPRRRLP
jgi:metallo-beta-lactamase family protein